MSFCNITKKSSFKWFRRCFVCGKLNAEMESLRILEDGDYFDKYSVYYHAPCLDVKPKISKKEAYRLLFEQMAMKNAYEKKLLESQRKG